MKKTVLITGVAGSLGRAFVKLLHQRYNIIGIDNSEWSVATLSKEYPDIKIILDDFCEWRFDQDPCDYVIHCGAYKHLPLGEENPNSFIDNNIIKLRKLFAEAYKNNVDLLFVSTDKAVEPCSLYGYSKAIGESLAKYYNFSITRCGNLLNSSGSVIPVWEDCIGKGKPIVITDERMVRWFIEVHEAADQMWGMFRTGKKLIIPNCKEIRILDLLAETLKRHGYKKASDYKQGVVITGIRSKEKLNEKLRWNDEM